MLFMVIERFKNREAEAVYRRFLAEGRLAPEGLTYLDSWVEANFARCFQLIDCDDPALLQDWVLAWQDLVDFEFCPVVPSKQVSAAMAARFDAGTATCD